jgi:DinB superfamily
MADTEPWLRGTLIDVPVVERALLHSLEMAEEDAQRWCGGLTEQELHSRPFQLPSVAFQLRHIVRSLDRFCTYAEGKPLTTEQFAALASEMDATGDSKAIFAELEQSLLNTRDRLQTIAQRSLDAPIGIGRKGLPTTLGGLLVHAAEHTQRHVGQAITTAKVIIGLRCDPSSPA